jgi:hypothetical protein
MVLSHLVGIGLALPDRRRMNQSQPPAEIAAMNGISG